MSGPTRPEPDAAPAGWSPDTERAVREGIARELRERADDGQARGLRAVPAIHRMLADEIEGKP